MSRKPNILFITTDHLRYDTLGYAGDDVIQTPTIDALAARSLRLDNHFGQNPVCQPSRAAMITGRYPRHVGVRWNGAAINENEMTAPEFFKRNGYTTASVGKHHIKQERFDKSLDHTAANHIRRGWKETDTDFTVKDPNEFEQYVRDRGFEYKTGYALENFRERLGAVPSDLPEDCHIDAYVGMKGREYIESVDADGKPFFLWLGFLGPHHPYVPSGRFAHMYDPDKLPPFHRADDDIARKPPEYAAYFREKNHKYAGFPDRSDRVFREMKAAYYGMVSQIDWALSLVLDALRERGLEDNTVIVFTSDHGDFLGDHGIPAKAPFMLDCMIHVPCLIHSPGQTTGLQSDALTESVDLFPTMASLAGLKPPEWIQGKDLTPLTTGDSGGTPRRAIYSEAVDKRCVRTREWKYIHYPMKEHGELYDLAADPRELRNLFDERPDIVEKMRDEYLRLMDETEDFRHPKFKRFGGTDPKTGDELTHYHTW